MPPASEQPVHHLSIVADDSPLQRQSRRASLSENGWEPCGENLDADITGTETVQPRAATIIGFPAQVLRPSIPSRRIPSERPPFIVITVDEKSRLLRYESHYSPANDRAPELAST